MRSRLLDVLAFVHFFTLLKSRPPSMLEIAAGLVKRGPRRRDVVGHRSKSGIWRMLGELEEHGMIEKVPHAARTWTLTPAGRARLHP